MENITTAHSVTLLNSTSDNTTRYYKDYVKSPLDYFTLVVFSLCFLLGTIGNGLVIWFTIFKMKKTVNVIWFINLSIADFTFTLILPLNIVYLANDVNWIFGSFLCKLNSTILSLNLFASVFLLTVISIDRCISVIFPVWCQNHRTPRRALFIVVPIWFLAILFSLPSFMYRDTFKYKDGYRCNYNYKPEETNGIGTISHHHGTVIFRFFMGFFIPFAIIVTCYSLIGLRIRRNHMTTSTKPFKVIIAVIVCFFICWLPYYIFSFLRLHSASQPGHYLYNKIRHWMSLSTSLACVNSCVNPFLYVFIGRDFKDKLSQSIQSIFEKAFNEDSMHKYSKHNAKTKGTSDSQVV